MGKQKITHWSDIIKRSIASCTAWKFTRESISNAATFMLVLMAVASDLSEKCENSSQRWATKVENNSYTSIISRRYLCSSNNKNNNSNNNSSRIVMQQTQHNNKCSDIWPRERQVKLTRSLSLTFWVVFLLLLLLFALYLCALWIAMMALDAGLLPLPVAYNFIRLQQCDITCMCACVFLREGVMFQFLWFYVIIIFTTYGTFMVVKSVLKDSIWRC